MNVYFVVHGSANIGMGHVMRSLSLAEAFRERGHHVVFFSKYELGIIRIRKSGFPVCEISDSNDEKNSKEFFYGRPEDALQDARYICKRLPEVADIMVIDSYNVTPEFFHILREVSRYLAYIDDLNMFPYPVDFLINGSAAAMDMGYEKTQSAQLLLGLSYNLIRREFRCLPTKQVKAEVTDILLTTGNSDPYHMEEKIRDILVRENIFNEITFHVIIGGGFEDGDIKDMNTWNDFHVQFYERSEDLSAIMLKCDLAITAGGTTLYELASCGVPAIVFSYAENQIPQIQAMENEGLLHYIENYQGIDNKKMIKCIIDLQVDYEKRKKLVKKLQSLVDAKGALRVVMEIERSCGSDQQIAMI